MADVPGVTTMVEVDEKDIEFVGTRPQKPLEIVDYRLEWPAMFAEVERRIRQALGDRVILIQHVGSTSVAGLAAKDIIDIDLVVADPADEASYVPDLQAAGFMLILREPVWYQYAPNLSLLLSIGQSYTCSHTQPDKSTQTPPAAGLHLRFASGAAH